MTRFNVALTNQQNAGRAITLLLIALAAGVPAYLLLGWQTGAWQFWALTAVVLLLSGFVWIARQWAQAGRIRAGVYLAFGGLMAALPLLTLFIAQIGALAGFVIILLILAIGSQTLSSREIRPLLFLAALTAATTIAIEFWQPPTQLTSTPVIVMLGVMAVFVLTGHAVITVRQFNDYSIFVKLIFTFLVLALAPLILLVATTSLFSHPFLTQTNNDRLMLAAVQTANNIDNFIVGNANAVRGEAQLPILVSYLTLPSDTRINSPAEAIALNTLRALKSKNEPFITSYALLDERGQVILDTQLANVGTDESARSHFRQPVMDRLLFYNSPVEFEGIGGAANFYFSSPIWDANDNLLGVLRARYNPIIFQQIMQQNVLLAGDESYPFLVDDNLLYLAHGQNPTAVYSLITDSANPPLQQLQSIRRLPAEPREPRVQLAPDLAESLRLDDNRRFFTSESIDVNGRAVQAAAVRLVSIPSWQVVVFQPRAIFTAPITNQLNVSLLLASVIAIVTAMSAFAISQRLGDPIRRLTEQAQRVAQGDLNVQMPVESGDEIGVLADTFNQMTAELRQTLTGLESRVAERTRALELTTEVSQRLSTILDQDKLVAAVVEQIKSKFDYYHVHIYLLDSDRQTLRMVGGTGEAGEIMLAANHKLPLGKGLVGRAAANQSAVLVADVSRDPNWLANPLLPDTKAELAVPIILGDELLGVIDVQQNKTEGLGENDTRLIQAIALQVAIGLQNARAFAQAQRQAEREALLNSISQQIQGSATVEMALQVAAREVGRALGAEQTIIKLKQKD